MKYINKILEIIVKLFYLLVTIAALLLLFPRHVNMCVFVDHRFQLPDPSADVSSRRSSGFGP